MNWINKLIARCLRHKRLYEYVHYRMVEASGVYYSPPGDYDSPMYSPREAIHESEALIRSTAGRDGVDLNMGEQLARLQGWVSWVSEFDWTGSSHPDRRYHRDSWFDIPDAFALYCIMREFLPRRIVEVGSGFSSALMLDVCDQFLDAESRFTFVEPYPDRLERLLRPDDVNRHSVRVEMVQNSPLDLVDHLQANDIFFIDSSHVLKCGGDLSFIFFQYLPRLRPGVIVHFHDIFWPFEYLLEWREIGRPWNELYVLRTFLQFNRDYEILFFGDYMVQEHRKLVEQSAPLLLGNSRPGSIWLRRRHQGTQ